MIREICKDEALSGPERQNLPHRRIFRWRPTCWKPWSFHKDGCVGMAANMIGVNKRIIAFDNEGSYHGHVQPGDSPEALAPYDTEEGCLSLSGTRPVQAVEVHQGALAE